MPLLPSFLPLLGSLKAPDDLVARSYGDLDTDMDMEMEMEGCPGCTVQPILSPVRPFAPLPTTLQGCGTHGKIKSRSQLGIKQPREK